MAGPLTLDHDAIADLCQKHGVRRLAVFGSAVTDEFDPDRSDVDFYLELLGDVENKFDAYFGLKESLEEMLGRPVDLVMSKARQNPYFARSLDETAKDLYAAA
jgi:predicted nucleotidyltransferase